MNARVNLAPEVYQASQRSKQKRQYATAIGSVVVFVSAAVLVVSGIILAGQKLYIDSLTGQIKDKQSQIAQLSDLPKAATAAQHLSTLTGLLDQKVYLTRFFTVLQDTTPQGIGLSTVSLNEANVVEMSASAKSYALATKFAKALEASNVTIGANSSPQSTPHFTNIQLSAVSSGEAGKVDFKLTATVAPEVERGK